MLGNKLIKMMKEYKEITAEMLLFDLYAVISRLEEQENARANSQEYINSLSINARKEWARRMSYGGSDLERQGAIIIGNELRMNILVIENDEQPYTKRIWNDLDSLRKIIGEQDIEVEEYEDILLVYNSNGIKDNLPINRYMNGLAIRGTFIITGNNLKEMDFMSLSNEQIDKYMEMFDLEREEDLEL